MTIIAPDMTPPPVDDQIERPEWLDTDRWPFALRRHTITHGDQELIVHVTDEGDGPTLVFVHAGMWSFVWRDAIEALRSRFRCISVDFPGSGLSDGEPADVDLTAFPALLDDVLDARGVERATFVVHDLGGVVGVHAAARRPGRLNGIVAVNTFAWRPDSRSLRVMLRVMGSRVVTGLIGTTRLVPRLTSTRAGVGRHLDRADRRAFFGPYRSRRAARSFHRAMRSARRSPQLFEAAEHLLATTFAEPAGVHGVRREERPIRLRRPLARHLPGSDLVDGAGREPLPHVRRSRRLRPTPRGMARRTRPRRMITWPAPSCV